MLGVLFNVEQAPTPYRRQVWSNTVGRTKRHQNQWIAPPGYTARDEHYLRIYGRQLGRELTETEKAIIFAAGQHEAQQSAEAVRVMARHLIAFSFAARNLAFEIDCVSAFTSWPVSLGEAFSALEHAAVPLMEVWTEWLKRRNQEPSGLYPTENNALDAVHELSATVECRNTFHALLKVAPEASSEQIKQCGILTYRLAKAYEAIADDRQAGARALRKEIPKGPTPDLGKYILVRWVWDNEPLIGWRSLGHAMARLGMEPDSESWLVSIEEEGTEGEPLSDEEIRDSGKGAKWEDRLKQWARQLGRTPVRNRSHRR